ncbi:MAG: hypothetical protein ACOC4I_04150 [Spirochaetota bacterium]
MFCAFVAAPSRASETPFQTELWAELEPFLSASESARWSAEAGARRLLETARFVFSGMAYGFRVTAVPEEPLRRVEARSEVTLRAQIPSGDRGLRTRQVREADGRLYGVFSFSPNSEQHFSRARFLGSGVARSSATGSASYFRGPSGIEDAIRDAVVRSVIVQARRETANRPAEITADVVLSQPPVLGIRNGRYTATVRTAVQIRTIRSYELF